MRTLANPVVGLLGLLALMPLLISGPGERARTPSRPIETDPGNGVPGQELAEVCATGCAAVPAPDLALTRNEFAGLVEAFADEPLAAGSPALERLLFHGAAAREWIGFLGSDALAALDVERAAFLERELERNLALLSVRVTDTNGVVRFALERVPLPLAEKQHLHPNGAVALQLPEISGTVQRVGVQHLWARL